MKNTHQHLWENLVLSTITFEHGEKTCAVSPGIFCRFQGVMGFGTRPVCMLFNNETLYDKDGWLQRCPACVQVYGTKETK